MANHGIALNDGERIVFTTRTHAKALLGPVLVLIVILVIAGVLTGPTSGWGTQVVWVLAALLVVVFVLVPFLRWWSSTYTVTDRRLITRTGVLTRKGHDIPLNRISDVSSERGILDRMLGCGTLIVSDASERGSVVLHDVPDAEKLQLQLSQQLHRGSQGSPGNSQGDDDGT